MIIWPNFKFGKFTYTYTSITASMSLELRSSEQVYQRWRIVSQSSYIMQHLKVMVSGIVMNVYSGHHSYLIGIDQCVWVACRQADDNLGLTGNRQDIIRTGRKYFKNEDGCQGLGGISQDEWDPRAHLALSGDRRHCEKLACGQVGWMCSSWPYRHNMASCQ